MAEAIIFDWVGTLYQRDKGPFEFSEKVLSELKKRRYKLALITKAADMQKRRNEILKSGLENLFDKVVIANEKTEKHYADCIKSFNSSPQKTIVVDDRAVRGISIGNKLGCQTF